MGCGEPDDSYQMETEQPSMNTTNRIQEQLDDIDFVMHIGDMSYALGYSSVVRGDAVATQDSLLWAFLAIPATSTTSTVVIAAAAMQSLQ